MEFLKGVISDELYTQLETALKDKKDIKLANLAGGAYVGKDKHDALIVERDGLKTQLGQANQAIEGFKGLNVEDLNRQITDWKTKAENAEIDAKKQVAEMKFDAALTSALTSAKARNPKAVKALLNMDALKLADDDVIGLKEQLEKLKTDSGYLFEPEAAGGAGFGNGAPPAANANTNAYMNSLIRGARGD